MEMSSPLSQLVDETADEDLSELELGEQASSETPTSGDQEEAAPSAPEALLEDAPVDADTGTPEINPQEMMSRDLRSDACRAGRRCPSGRLPTRQTSFRASTPQWKKWISSITKNSR